MIRSRSFPTGDLKPLTRALKNPSYKTTGAGLRGKGRGFNDRTSLTFNGRGGRNAGGMGLDHQETP